MPASNRNAWLAASAVFVAACLVHAANLDRALLGWDSYATLLAARVDSFAALTGTFSEKLMDGRLAFGDFYRPVGNVFVALDMAIWGMRPAGHQATSILVFAAASALLFVVVWQRSRAGTRGHPASQLLPGLVASGLFVLHPAALSVLPVVARRTETLMLCFVLAALAMVPRAGASPGRRRVWAAAFAVCAVGSKEPGVLVLPLLALDAACAAGAAGARARVRDALSFTWPAIAAIAAFAVLRTAVLGGLGGYFETPDSPYALRLLTFAPDYLEMLLATGGLAEMGLSGLCTAGGCAALLVGLGVRVRRLKAAAGAHGESPWSALALPALGGAWLAIQIALASTTGKPEPRYALGLVVGLAFLVAGLVDGALAAAEGRRVASAPADSAALAPADSAASAGSQALLLAAAAAVPLVFALAGSPLWRSVPQLAEASRIQTGELADLEQRLAVAEPGRHRVRLQKLVPIFDPAVDHAWMLSPWGVQAWAELVFPGRRFVVETDPLVRPEAGYWHLVVIEEPAAGG